MRQGNACGQATKNRMRKMTITQSDREAAARMAVLAELEKMAT